MISRSARGDTRTISNFFSNSHGDIREWMLISCVNDISNKREFFLDINLFHILLRSWLSALYTYRLNLALNWHTNINSIVFFTGVADTGEKFIDFCTCVRHTYVRRKDARTFTDVRIPASSYVRRTDAYMAYGCIYYVRRLNTVSIAVYGGKSIINTTKYDKAEGPLR